MRDHLDGFKKLSLCADRPPQNGLSWMFLSPRFHDGLICHTATPTVVFFSYSISEPNLCVTELKPKKPDLFGNGTEKTCERTDIDDELNHCWATSVINQSKRPFFKSQGRAHSLPLFAFALGI